MELDNSTPSREIQPTESGIIGDVIIGEINPRTLTETEFNQSPALLFHGAAKEFNYSPEGKYDPTDTGGDGTTDYGAGLYTTDNRGQASNYSIVRSSHNLEKPLVYSFLPDHARMLDVRDSIDSENNGILPREFVKKWLDFLREYTSNEENYFYFNEYIKEVVRNGAIKKFLEPTQKAYDEGKPIKIRGGRHNIVGVFARDSNGLIDITFQKFMLSQGYDGMIYREGGEGEQREDLTGYIFYNYKAVDTWQGWQTRNQRGE